MKQRLQRYQDLDKMRSKINEIPGFERFLLPPTEEDICQLANEGPIICFALNSIRNDALIITTEAVESLALSGIKENDIELLVKDLAQRGNSTRRDVTIIESDDDEVATVSDIRSLLITLWDKAVLPVLEKLGLTNGQDYKTLPRIWWVGSGRIAALPFHAAGEHTLGPRQNTLSYAISSYAPSLKSLQYTRKPANKITSDYRSDVLIVSMPTTPSGYKPLDVAHEVTAIQRYNHSSISVTHLQNPRKNEVLSKINNCTVAHFVCHGIADSIQPAKSALLVGEEDEELLTIEELDSVAYGKAQIAYLSACSTAEVKALELADESVHLANAFQLAGFQHVIASLWEVDDRAAVAIAATFYEGLLQQKKLVASALNDAVVHFRGQGGDMEEFSK